MNDTILIPLSPEQRKKLSIEKLQPKAIGYGITLASGGTFTGRASGKLVLEPNKAVITLTDKPWMIPVSVIASQLRTMLADI